MKVSLNNSHKIALITFFSSLYMYGHVGTLYLQERGLSLFQASLITSVMILTVFLAEVPTGVIADRLGRKRSLIVALSLQFVGELLYIFSTNIFAFLAISVIGGLGFAFASGCVEALIYDSLPQNNREDQMKVAMGLKGSAYYLAFFLAPLIGSTLLPTFTIGIFLVVVAMTAMSVLAALLISFTLEEPKTTYEHSEESPFETIKAGVACIKGSQFLVWLTMISVLTATFFGTLVSLFQPYLVDFSVNARSIGLISALGAFLAIFAQKNILFVERKLGKKTTFLLSIFLPGIGYMFMFIAPNPLVALIAFVLTYGLAEIKNPLISSYQNSLIPEKIRATVLSLINLVSSLYVAIIGLLMGWLADINTSYPFALAGFLILMFSVILRVDKIFDKLD